MKTVLFLSHSASRTGAPLLLKEIVSHLDRDQVTPVFLLGEDGPLADAFRAIGPTWIDPFYPSELKYWREIKRIVSRIRLLRSIHPDLVYCNTIHPVKWLLYAKLLNIPTLTHVHELSYGFATLGPAEHFLLRSFSDGILAVSDAVRSYLISVQRVAPEKITTIHAGIRVGQFGAVDDNIALRKSLGVEGAIVVGTVGRITPMKGSDLFLDVVHSLKKRTSPGLTWKFIALASTDDAASYRRFIARIDELHLSGDIILLENVEQPERYYGAMDMFVSTAREDPFPLVVMEAMASRLPVIGFRVGGIPEAVTPETGILIEPFDLSRMVEAIVQLACDPSKRSAMGRKGRTRVEKAFDLERNIEDIQALIMRTIGSI